MGAASAPLRRIANVIDVVAAAPDGLPLGEIADQLQLPLPTAHRIVRSLVDIEYLSGQGGRSHYRLGPRFLRLFQLTLGEDVLQALCSPVMQPIADDFECSCFMTKLVNDAPRLVVNVLPAHSTGAIVHPGYSFPINATSSGKVLFAFQPEAVMRAATSGRFKKFRPKTVVSTAQVRAMLAQAKKDGYAVSDDELDAGVYAVSVPIAVENLGTMYSLGVVGLREALLSKATLPEIVATLRGSADVIAGSLVEPFRPTDVSSDLPGAKALGMRAR